MKRKKAKETDRKRTPLEPDAIMRGEVMEMAAAERNMKKDSQGNKYVDEGEEYQDKLIAETLRKAVKDYEEKQKREERDLEDLKDEDEK